MDLLQLKQALEDSQIEKNIIECSVDEYLSVLCQYFSILARIISPALHSIMFFSSAGSGLSR